MNLLIFWGFASLLLFLNNTTNVRSTRNNFVGEKSDKLFVFLVEYINNRINEGLRCLPPRMGGLKGEAGESPALSRNCKPGSLLVSQDARLFLFYTTSRKGGVNGIEKKSHPKHLPCPRTGVFISCMRYLLCMVNNSRL